MEVPAPPGLLVRALRLRLLRPRHGEEPQLGAGAARPAPQETKHKNLQILFILETKRPP